MSRAFVKKNKPDNSPLSDLPVSPHPNCVAPCGRAALHSRLAQIQAALLRLRDRPDRLDRLPEAAAECDIGCLEARLCSAMLVDPARQPQNEVAFGARLTLWDDAGRVHNFEITGEDAADAGQGRIAPQPPLARALPGARSSDLAQWARRLRQVDILITAVSYPDAR